MADVTVPNTLANGTTADAADVQANFDALVSWINTNAIRKDGTIAFTAVPTGPASDPSSDNQLARKKYVDDRVGLKSGYATANHTFTAADVYQTIDTVTISNPGKAVVVEAWASALTLSGASGSSSFRYQFKVQISLDNGSSYTDSSQNFVTLGSTAYGSQVAFLRVAGTPTGNIKIRTQHYQQSGGLGFGQAAESSIMYQMFKTVSV